jgi:hypothetical protein
VYSQKPGRLIALILFGLWPLSARATPAKPIIVSAPNSTRALAMESVELTPEPFPVRSNSFLYGADRSTRIMIFVLNLSLQAGETASAITADAEDGTHRHYNLAVEYAGKIPGQEWLGAVVLKLDQDMGDAGDVLLQLTYQNIKSNRARVGVGHVGGGPADDQGSGPTPAPPYTLSGQVILGGSGLSGVTIDLAGPSPASAVTGSNGMFSFVVNSAGDYTVTASKRFFTLSPATILLNSFCQQPDVQPHCRAQHVRD